MERENKKSKRIGMIVSITLHAIFLLLALFTVSCWTSKGPPHPSDQIGVLLHGDTDGLDNNLETDIEEVIEEPVEEVVEEEIDESEPVEEEPVEEVVEEEAEEIETIEDSYDNNSEVSYTEKEEPTKKVEVAKKKTETKKKSVYTSAKSEGDTKEKGIKGDPKATEKAQNVYAKKGGGGGGKDDKGLSLSLNGWKWEAPPKTKEITHSGEVEFTFIVTEDGEVLDITVVKSSFTPAETEILKNKLYDIAFLQTSNGAPPAETEGRLIWKFVAK